MPPKKATSTEEGAASGTAPSMTDGEMKFIKAMFDNMTQRPDADWEQVAADLGLKDAKCAKERFRQMSVKHGWRESGGGASGGGLTTPRKPRAAATPRSRASGTPTKVTKPRAPRKTPTKKGAKSKTEVASSDDDAEMKLEDQERVFNEEFNTEMKFEVLPKIEPEAAEDQNGDAKAEDKADDAASSSELSDVPMGGETDDDYKP